MIRSHLDLLPRYSFPLLVGTFVAVVLAFVIVRLTFGPAVSLSRRTGLIVLRVAWISLLIALLANPVRVSESSGVSEPAEMFMVLDASESMALDDAGATRWDRAVEMVRQAKQHAMEPTSVRTSLFRFGRRLQAIPGSQASALLNPDSALPPSETVDNAEDSSDGGIDRAAPPTPDQPDTQLLVALRQITSRFGQRLPAGVVVFSDGRARDADGVQRAADHFSQLRVPIHVVPLGNATKGGDVSIVALVAPAVVRKNSQISAYAFVRSYGYAGTQAELELFAVDADRRAPKKLDAAPLVLSDGFQTVNLNFESSEDTRTLLASIKVLPDEIAADNNQFETEVQIDRTKIRVMYLEGNRQNLLLGQTSNDLKTALELDSDVECTLTPVVSGQFSGILQTSEVFPRTPAELASYDAVILSGVPRSYFADEQLDWLEEWIAKRGAGLCMVGGPAGYADGGWEQSVLRKILPVSFDDAQWDASPTAVIVADASEPLHPILRFAEEYDRNRTVLNSFPTFTGLHRRLAARNDMATVLAKANLSGGPTGRSSFVDALLQPFSSRRDESDRARRVQKEGRRASATPAITAGRYGRGRTLALAFPIVGAGASEFTSWGDRDNEYYARFWRNALYWLTENSFIGRRRLSASTDKRFYQPGENVVISAAAYNEAAEPTTEYRIVAMIEPQSLDVDSDFAPVRWPSGVERTGGIEGPMVMWGEEFEIPVRKTAEGQSGYALELELADAQSLGDLSGGVRIEITAYEDYTQVDSTSLPLMVLYDPFEQQNPFPNHELLASLAELTGGRVVESPEELAELLQSAPIATGPPEVYKTPVWSTWWLLLGLIGLLTVDWSWRRSVGLA